MPRRVPQSVHLGVPAEDGSPVGSCRTEAGPHALHRLRHEGREQPDGATEDLGKPLVRDARIVPGPLHRAAEHGVGAAGQDVAVVVEENRGRAAVGPRGRGHLAAQRLDGQGARQAADLRRPHACGEHGVLDRRGAVAGDDSRHAAVPDGERVDSLGVEGGTQAARVREAGARQPLRVQRAVLGSEERALAVGRGAGPALAHFVAVQPVATEAGLALPGHLLLEALGGRLVERDGGDSRAPEPDVDAGGFPQGGGERLVQIPGAHRQGDQHVVTGLDLRGQHPGGRRRRGGGVGARLEDGDFQPPQGGSPGARRPHRTATHDRDIDRLHRLAPP